MDETPPEAGAQPEPGAADAVAEPPAEAPAEATAEADLVESTTASEAAIDSGQGDNGTIVVTGSRLRSRTFGSSVPVDVIDQKQLEKAGAKNLADVVQYMVGSQGTGAQGNSGGGISGATTTAVNLRGLGAGATLVLLNGRRLNPSGAALDATFADMSVIPIAAVERLEVLKAGASAIYGADAVGGVINIITRRNWDGAKAQFDGQTTSRWDHSEYTASASVGTTSERGRMLAAVSYFRRTELNVTKRSFPPDKYTAPPAVWPPAFVSYTDKPTQLLTDPVCARAPGFCTPSYAPYIYLFPNSERANAFASAEYDLTSHATLLAELTVSRYRGDAISLPSFNVTSKTILIPADHVDNPFGKPLALLGAPLGAPTGPQRQTSADDSFRAVLGLKGDLNGITPALENWQWEAYTSYGISRYRESIPDNLVDSLQLAINSCSDPNDLSNCFNPFYSAYDGTGTPNTASVIERFRSSQVLQADHALQTYNLGLSGSLFALPGGDVGLAFGGEIRKEWRVLEFDHDANLLRFGFVAGNSNQRARREVYGSYLEVSWPFYRGVELRTAARLERYTDTNVNAVSPFAAFSLAPGEIIGQDKAPGWLQRLQLRGAASRAFRAPTISNTNPGYGTAPAPLQYQMQPGGPANSTYVPVRYYGNPALKPETAVTFSGGLSWTPINEISVTGDYWYYDYKDRIQPQSAQTVLSDFQAGGEIPSPPGVRAPVEINPNTRALTLVNVQYLNLPGSIHTSGVDFSLNVRIDGATFGGKRDDFGQFGLGVDGTFTNNFTLPRSDAGGAYATHCSGPAGNESCDVAGFRNYYTIPVALPKLRANIPLTWTLAGAMATHSVALIGHYISAFADDYPRMPGAIGPDGKQLPPPPQFYPDLAAWFSFDLQYSLSLKKWIGEELSFRVGCQNVTDEMPPLVQGADSHFAGEVHDPRGRMFYASVGSEF